MQEFQKSYKYWLLLHKSSLGTFQSSNNGDI